MSRTGGGHDAGPDTGPTTIASPPGADRGAAEPMPAVGTNRADHGPMSPTPVALPAEANRSVTDSAPAAPQAGTGLGATGAAPDVQPPVRRFTETRSSEGTAED